MSGNSVYKVSKWLGINENPDGDTELKAGEAADMINFRITPDWSLQLRPGRYVVAGKTWSGEVRGVWSGRVGDMERVVFAAGGVLYAFDMDSGVAVPILAEGVSLTDDRTEFFGFSGKLYIQNGHEYLEWDGLSGAFPVEGYRPLLAVSCSPEGGGTELEQINKLTSARRVWFSPDGTAEVFSLPEGNLAGIDYVRLRATGEEITAYTADLNTGTLTFEAAPEKGTNSLEIGYCHSSSQRAEVTSMRFAEIYNGTTDNRVFLCGDGTNMAIYSGLDYDGIERADYFPDLNVLHVGTANTPVTGMIRHYSRLAVFKTDSAYSIDYGTVTLTDGRVAAAFYITPSNRAVGNEAPGEIRLVDNSPRTLTDGTVVEWKNYSSYSANLTSDERQARIISERVQKTLGTMDLTNAHTFFDRKRREYYVYLDGTAVINGIATDTWYIYRGFDFTHLFEFDRRLYGFLSNGELALISRQYQNDCGDIITARWRSGSLAFNRDWNRKYASRVFLTLKPETRAALAVSLQSNRQGSGELRTVSSGLASFSDCSFEHWSFGTNRRPQTKRLKLRAKKFAYLQLLLDSATDWSTATLLTAEVQLRYGGEVR